MNILLVESNTTASDTSQITNLLKESDDNLKTFISGNKKVNGNIDDWVINNQDTVRDSWRGFSLGVVLWGWFICIGALITISAQALEKPNLAKGLCCFWLFAGIVSLLGFILAVATLAVGLVTDNSCGLLKDILKPGGIDKYNVIIPSDIEQYMNECLYKNGDISLTINLIEPLSYVTNLTNYEAELQKYNINPSLGSFQSISYNEINILNSTSYSNIASSDTNPQDTPDNSLVEFNKFTNSLATDSYQTTCTTNFSKDQ